MRREKILMARVGPPQQVRAPSSSVEDLEDRRYSPFRYPHYADETKAGGSNTASSDNNHLMTLHTNPLQRL